MVSRVERTPFAAWWWTVDRLMLAALRRADARRHRAVARGSPPVAARLGLEPFYFVDRHVLYLIPATAVHAGDLVPAAARSGGIALVVFVLSLILVAATPYSARRSRAPGAGWSSSASTSSRRSSSSPPS